MYTIGPINYLVWSPVVVPYFRSPGISSFGPLFWLRLGSGLGLGLESGVRFKSLPVP